MRKLTLDETWSYTKRMWEWIAFRIDTMLDGRSVEELKKVWLKENAPEFVNKLEADCFFCQETGDCSCTKCPGRLVAPEFDCQGSNNPYHYHAHPGAFCREILRLDAIRTAEPVVPVKPEHEWVHGDVFKNSAGRQVYCLHEGKPIIVNFDIACGGFGTPLVQLEEAEFLFNIIDKL
jgi:hypothetical protein